MFKLLTSYISCFNRGSLSIAFFCVFHKMCKLKHFVQLNNYGLNLCAVDSGCVLEQEIDLSINSSMIVFKKKIKLLCCLSFSLEDHLHEGLV